MHIVTSADGTLIAYDRTGSGPPLVLVGGAFSNRRYPGPVKLAELVADRGSPFTTTTTAAAATAARMPLPRERRPGRDHCRRRPDGQA